MPNYGELSRSEYMASLLSFDGKKWLLTDNCGGEYVSEDGITWFSKLSAGTSYNRPKT